LPRIKFRNCPADFVQELLALHPPTSEVRRTRLFSSTWEDKVGHLDAIHGAASARGPRVDFPANPRGGLTDFVRGSDVPDDRRIDLSVVDHSRVIADRWRESVAVVAEHETRHHDGGVCVGDQEALRFELSDDTVCLVDRSFQLTVSFRRKSFKRKLLLQTGQPLFVEWKDRAWTVGEFRPTVTGLRLKGWRACVDGKIPVSVGTIAVQVHIPLDEESFASRINVLQLKNGLAIVEIMPGEKQVQPIKAFT
jgi:hypothetical protein